MDVSLPWRTSSCQTDSGHSLGGVMAGYLKTVLQGRAVANADALGKVLGHVVFSTLAAFSAGRCSAEEMEADLVLAARVVLD